VTETDNRSCSNDPLGYAERVFKFMAMFGDIADVPENLAVPAARDVNRC
jgi:hypothetical protein